MTMFHRDWLMEDEYYFDDRHCDNSIVILNYNSSWIKFQFRIVFLGVCLAPFQCFCLFVFVSCCELV